MKHSAKTVARLKMMADLAQSIFDIAGLVTRDARAARDFGLVGSMGHVREELADSKDTEGGLLRALREISARAKERSER